MIEIFPDYYEKFHCIADRCEDTCCAGWEIDIDDESYERYMRVPGKLGERLRRSIKSYQFLDGDMDETIVQYDETDKGSPCVVCASENNGFSAQMDETIEKSEKHHCYEEIYAAHGFKLTSDMRCPFLDENNLCELYLELGEDSLCEVCTHTPRNYLEYGGVREISISASCPEAARLIYGQAEPIRFVRRDDIGRSIGDPSGVCPQDDNVCPTVILSVAKDPPGVAKDPSGDEQELSNFLRNARGGAIEILQDRTLELEERIRRFLDHAGQVQDVINRWESGEIDNLWEMVGGLPGETDAHGGSYSPAVDPSSSMGADNDGNPADPYRAFLIRMNIFSGLASIGQPWADRMGLLFDSFVGDEDFADDEDGYAGESCNYMRNYLSATDGLDKLMREQGRVYEYEHLLVYYAFLLLNRSIDDYDYLTKAKLVVMSYEMNRDMDAGVFFHKKCFDKRDREENARIYAREVEHAEENLADLTEEILFT